MAGIAKQITAINVCDLLVVEKSDVNNAEINQISKIKNLQSCVSNDYTMYSVP